MTSSTITVSKTAKVVDSKGRCWYEEVPYPLLPEVNLYDIPPQTLLGPSDAELEVPHCFPRTFRLRRYSDKSFDYLEC